MLRKILLAAALTFGALGAGVMTSGTAQAITITAPAALDQAAPKQADQVRYVCRRYWNGFRWKRSCFWRPGPYYGYRYRPYRHRHYGWRRW